MATINTALQFRGSIEQAGCGQRAIERVRVCGDLTDAATAADAARRLREACRTARRLIVDAAGVVDADTKIIAVLVDLRRRSRRRGTDIVILPSSAVRRWLTICRLESILR